MAGERQGEKYADNPDEWREAGGGAVKEPRAGSTEQSATTGAEKFREADLRRPSFTDCGIDATVKPEQTRLD